LPVALTGKEELRTTILLPYLLRLRDERGEGAVRALLATVGIPPNILDDDASWVSVAAARRTLQALATALGEEAIRHPGAWMTHPETLGARVRMLRVASEPGDAYRYLAASLGETSRVGQLELEGVTDNSAALTYRPRPDVDADQNDILLCLTRQAELASVPRIWGLDEAQIEHPQCLAKGDPCCSYKVKWVRVRPHRTALFTLAGGVVSGGAVLLSGSWIATGIALVVGTGLGTLVGALYNRVAREKAARVLERNRIMALERGLEMKGQFRTASGDLTGTLLGGKYRILNRIGSGGIGAVYSAEHALLGSRVAIKVLRGAAAMDASEIARLRREAQVQVSIEHPNVVRTLDLDQMADGSIYVVMELLSGTSLAERLRKRGPLTASSAVPIFVQVCRALGAAHDLGIVHRDLKPANIFISEDGTVKVLDFGMSKLTEAESLTQDGYTLGTPEYMSPEQCIGAPVDARSDIYAFGALMYEALTGETPIGGRNRRELLELQQHALPKPMRDRRPELDVPAGLDRIVLLCLRKRAAERPSSARALELLLTDVMDDVWAADEQAATAEDRVRAGSVLVKREE
jgi:eukaryotic-like serine/threonine-protein kinase